VLLSRQIIAIVRHCRSQWFCIKTIIIMRKKILGAV
jgi:hypothetical protein